MAPDDTETDPNLPHSLSEEVKPSAAAGPAFALSWWRTAGLPGVRAVLLASALVLAFVGQDFLDARDHLQAAIALYVTALALAALAFAGWRSPAAEFRLKRWQEFALLAAILALALALRLFRWDTIPPGVVFDEAANGLEAERIGLTNDHYLWSDPLSGRPTLYLEVLAGFLKVFGVEVFVLRFVSILIGLTTIAFVFLFAREAFGSVTALLAAYVMAVMRWANHYSRLALEAVMAPLFVVACAYFLLRGLRTGQLWCYAVAGAALALGLYTYISFRLVPLVFGAFLLLVIVQGRGTLLRRQWLGLAAFTVIFLAVFAPLGQFANDNEERFSGRFGEVSVFQQVDETGSWDPLLGNIARHLEMFNYQGPWFGGMNVPYYSMLAAPLAVLFALSLALVVVRLHKPAYYLMLFWFAAGLTAGIVTVQEETPHATRTIIILPLVAIGSALFLREAVALGAQALGRVRYLLALPAVAVLVAIGVIENQTYFNTYAKDPNVCNAFTCEATILANFVDEVSPDSRVYMASEFYHFPTDAIVDFVAADSRGKHRPLDISRDVPSRDADGAVVYILENSQRVYLPLLQRVYPNGTLQPQRWVDGRDAFVTYAVSREEAQSVFGLNAYYYANAAFEEPPAVERREATLGGETGPASLPLPYSVGWSGTIYVPSFDTYRYSVDGPGQGEVFIDGQPWPEQGQELEKGLHAINIRYRPRDREAPSLLWETEDGALKRVPDDSLFAFETGPQGLRATYWENDKFEGEPAFIQIDPVIFANNILPGPHSIEWTGWLRVDVPGEYKLATVSDDGSLLYIDDALTVDASGAHGAQRQEGRRFLSQGYHPIRVRYYEGFGGRHMELFWTPPGGDEASVPPDALFFRLPPGAVEARGQ